MKPLLFALIAFLAGLLSSCSSGPAPPAKGTPAFYWSAAKESFNAGDYTRTVDNLSKLTSSENEFRKHAQPWRLILLAGLVKGNADLADQYETGARANKANPAPFRMQTSTLRSEAGRQAMEFVESFMAFQKANPSGDVEIVFPYPPVGTAKAPPAKIAGGILPSQSEADSLRTMGAQRAVLLAVCDALGNGDDPAKAQEAMAKTPLTVPRATFLLAMSEFLNDQADLFGKRKLDVPDREKIFRAKALEALQGLPDSKELKELRKKIEGATKKS
ncbi:MAG: hypothetical protein IANPNBLG_01751 [Bryobacteraceae bacterium]|nr:hypothetical protein [Bryobacteraceae bacterium]